jgi:DnaK suppressor protein
MPRDLRDVERLLRERLEEIQERIAGLAKTPEPGSGIGFGKRVGDGTTEAISRRNEIGIGSSLEVSQERLQRALAKVEDGSYGMCDLCDAAIAPARLEAAPESTTCIKCAR